MKSLRIAAVLILGLVLTGFTACNPFDGEEEVISQPVEVARGDLTVTVSGSGNIVISNEAKLAFGTGGKIDKIYVDEGDKVSEGEVLAELGTDALELALTQAKTAQTQAEAVLVQAEATLVQASASRDDAEYNLTQLKKVLRASHDRVKVAESYLEAAELQVKAAESQLEAAASQLEAAGQAITEAQRQLDEASITAPLSGLVANVYVEEGDNVSTVTTILHLIDPTTMELKAEVDEIDIPSVEPRQRVIIEVDALPALEFEGRVTYISLLPTEEAGVILYTVTIDLDVPEGSGIKAGMSADADIIIDERSNVLLVPSRVIKHDSQGNPVVEVMVNKEIEEKPVVIGISDGYQTEIIDGLDEGEVVLRKTS